MATNIKGIREHLSSILDVPNPTGIDIPKDRLLSSNKYIWVAFLIGYITAPYVGGLWNRLALALFFFAGTMLWNLVLKRPMNITENLLIILATNVGWIVSRLIYKHVCEYHQVIPDVKTIF